MGIIKRNKARKKEIKRLREQAAANMQGAVDLYHDAREQGSQAAPVQAIDQGLQNAQRRALDQLEQVGRQGYTDVDRAAMDMAQRQAEMGARAEREAVMSDMRARGMGGSGLEMLGALTAQDAAAQRASDYATNLGMAGRDRALSAIESGAALAGGIDAQRFGQQMGRAGALDQFSQWATGGQAQAQGNLAGFQEGQAQQLQEQQNQFGQRVLGAVTGFMGLGTQLGMGIAGAKAGGGGGGMGAAQGAMGRATTNIRRNGFGGGGVT